jgi:hypothetical protein
MVLGAVQLAGGHGPELAAHLVVAGGEPDQGAALDDQHFAVGDCFRRKGMNVADLKAEHIAGEVERADLAAAVVEDLIGPYRAADDLVEVFGRLVFSEDLGIAADRHRRGHRLDRAVTLGG